MKEYMIETSDLILKKAVFDDWYAMYQSIWSHEESAKYMLWKVIATEEQAKLRMKKCLEVQEKSPFNWTVYEKKTGQAIGWAVVEEIEPGVFEDQGIAIGPAFVNKGYGKQIVNVIVDFLQNDLNAKKVIFSYRSNNIAAKKMLEACGFVYSHSIQKVDKRTGREYILEYMGKKL